MARPRKARYALPSGVNAVTARGKRYYYLQPGRGGQGRRSEFRESLRTRMARRIPPGGIYHRLAGEPKATSKSGTFIALVEAYKLAPNGKRYHREHGQSGSVITGSS